LFSKICGDIRKPSCTININDTGVYIATSFNDTCVVDTGGKFATGVNNTGSKFVTGVNDAGCKLPLVLPTLVPNLPPVSLTPVANNGKNIILLTI
jgi:hypothetical protein